MSVIRAIITLLILIVALPVFILMMVAGIVLSYIMHPKYFYFPMHLGCKALLLGSWQYHTIHGNVPPKNKGPYIFMFNHESMFDAFMLGASIPYYVNAVGWEGIFKWPLWGFFAKRYGAYQITHDDTDKARETLKAAEKILLVDKTSMIYSPEGNRTITGEMGEFKKGGFHFARATNATIVPIGIIGAFESNVRTSWIINPGRLKTVFGSPITPDQYSHLSIEDFRDLVKAEVVKLVEDFS